LKSPIRWQALDTRSIRKAKWRTARKWLNTMQINDWFNQAVPALPATLPPQVVRSAPAAVPPHPHMESEKLDPQMIKGVAAEGTRRTRTWPVGSVGNDREFISTEETWTSPELQVIILNNSSDPRCGDRVQKLINISRDEPDASLFNRLRTIRWWMQKARLAFR
jgi:hypothetical protein